MSIQTLKRLIAVLFISAFALASYAQQDHFIYMQTENGQPFYVKLNNKVVSSSSAGYIIIPKLNDSNYSISVGFPKNEFPEVNFNLSVAKNEGYLLKNFGDNGWGLFNLQSFAVMTGNSINKNETVSKNLQNDPFSRMLANVVKDSTILQKDEPVASVSQVPKNDSSDKIVLDTVAKTNDTVAKINDTTKAAEVKSTALSPATKLLSKKNKDGMEMVYLDPAMDGNDTIRIFLPSPKEIIKPENTLADTVSIQNKDILSSHSDTAATVETSNTQTKPNDASVTASPVFIDGISSVKNKDSLQQKNHDVNKADFAKQDSIKEKNIVDNTTDNSNKIDTVQQSIGQDNASKDDMVVLPKVVNSSKVNSDCKAFANNEEFLRLRKKMASENSDENMIKVAKKAFHSRCFSTEQIKNLSFLFLTNEGKYKFFDEAYAFTSDSDQYYTLQSQLTDSYYINRFKAMIHQ